jgi:subtilase family serine protease
LGPEEFTQKFGPSESDYQALIAFVKSQGLTVTQTYNHRQLLDVTGRADDIRKAFHINLDYYQRPDGTRFYATDSDPSPDSPLLLHHISGLNNFQRAFPKSKRMTRLEKPLRHPETKGGTGSGGAYQGEDFRDIYLPGAPAAVNGAGQSVALLEFDGFYQADINTYENSSAPPFIAPAPTVKVADNFNGFNGTPVNLGNNDEVSLDIEMVISLSPGAQVISYEGSPYDDVTTAANDIFSSIANDGTCKQISSSWGGYGDAGTSILMGRLAAQGQAYFEAAGDYGSYVSSGVLGNTSVTDDKSLYLSPFETLVGGTMVTSAGTPPTWFSETTWNDGYTSSNGNLAGGGGICSGPGTTYLAIPSYQSPVPMTTNGGSASARNFPDVSMIAYNIMVYSENGHLASPFVGTSCASPLWAAFCALANQQAAPSGKSIGFINPSVYNIGLNAAQFATDFHDIKDGSTNFYYWPTSSGPYTAVSGFDLATGWGSPTGQNLINHLIGYAPTNTPTFTATISPTITRTPTVTNTPTITLSPTITNTPTITYTPTPTATVSGFFLTSNQFNSQTGPPLQITYLLTSNSQVDVKVYTVTGILIRTVLSGTQPAGSYYLPWDGKDDNGQPVETGLYLIAFKTPSSTQVKKVLAYRR